VSEAAAEVVRSAAGKDLGLACEAAKGARLNNALAVPLKGVARGTFGRGKYPRDQLVLWILRYGTRAQIPRDD